MDRVNTETPKEIKMIVSKPFVNLFNKHIESGIFPPEFKIAVIKPLFKKLQTYILYILYNEKIQKISEEQDN